MKNSLSAQENTQPEELHIRPYARLITMLGDQLITDEAVALTEIIKNSYDADASWVKVTFKGFDEDFQVISDESSITIEDDGSGMTDDVLKNHWLNPATPEKLRRKRAQPVTPKHRMIQGEKGIGRFAVFKLGNRVTITTRYAQENKDGIFTDSEHYESVLRYDLTHYDEDLLVKKNSNLTDPLFLEQIPVLYNRQNLQIINNQNISLGTNSLKRSTHGTTIEISALRGEWSKRKVNNIIAAVTRLRPISHRETVKEFDFNIYFYTENHVLFDSTDEDTQTENNSLDVLIENKAVLRVTNGSFDQEKRCYYFNLNNKPILLPLNSSEITGLSFYNSQDSKARDILRIEDDHPLKCGNFKFDFYLFDFQQNKATPDKFRLDRKEKEQIKGHRIYLYRDGIRVIPYGDPSDDWLNIDVYRGTVRSSLFPSNDQIVGWIYITQKDNPNLKDKTSREGLLENGEEVPQFIAVIQCLLAWLRSKPYQRYLEDKKKIQQSDAVDQQIENQLVSNLHQYVHNDEAASIALSKLTEHYDKVRSVYENRIRTTENLAAVGLSVETASHDFMIWLRRVIEQVQSLYSNVREGTQVDQENLVNELSQILSDLGILQTQMSELQELYPSTKQRAKQIRVNEVIVKVKEIYRRLFNKRNIAVNQIVTGSPVVARTTDAVLLQVFINLFDNAAYWLNTLDSKDRQILIVLDGNSQTITFSDNGPGISKEDEPYIFQSFYSGKGEEGRGLGLYIARQLLSRYDYSIRLAQTENEKRLSGANFVLTFVKDSDDDE